MSEIKIKIVEIVMGGKAVAISLEQEEDCEADTYHYNLIAGISPSSVMKAHNHRRDKRCCEEIKHER